MTTKPGVFALDPSVIAYLPIASLLVLTFLTVGFYAARRWCDLPRSKFDAPERTLDILLASVLVVVMSPLMLLIALAIKLDGGWGMPILTRSANCSRRFGLGGRVFRVAKFRTMNPGPHEHECRSFQFIPAMWDERVTRVGRFLRKTGLDEVPLLFNVIAGQMSIFGPKAVTPEEAAALLPHVPARFRVKPGIISQWDVDRYRVDPSRRRVIKIVDFEQWMIEEDLYAQTMSIGLNLKTLVHYIPKLVGRLVFPVQEDVRSTSTRFDLRRAANGGLGV